MRARPDGRARGRTPGTPPGARWSTGIQSRSPSVLVLAADRRADLVRAEAALGQEPRLPALLGPGRGEFCPEALAPDLGTAPAPVCGSSVHRRRNRFGGNASLAQAMGDADRSPAAICMIRDEMLGEAPVVQEALLAQALDRLLRRGSQEAARDQALRDFAGTVVTPV